MNKQSLLGVIPLILIITGGTIMVLSYLKAESIGFSFLYPPFNTGFLGGLIVAAWGSLEASLFRIIKEIKK